MRSGFINNMYDSCFNNMFDNVFSESGGTTPAQAIYATANSVFSLRKLNVNYTGACIRVRRSSDNVETDIGFNNNVLDTAALLTFTGSNSAFVVTWYGQSGESRNATQTTASLQPRIVNAGVLHTLNGKPTIDQFSINARLNIPAFSGMTSTIVSAVYAQAADNNGFSPWQLRQLNLIDHLPWTDTFAYVGIFSTTRPQFGVWAAAANQLIVASAVQTGTALEIYRNGTQNGTTQASTFVLPSSQSNRTIFSGLNGTGFVSELIVLSAWDGGSTNRTIIQADQGAYFGITITTLPVAPVLATPTATDTTLALTWTMSNDTDVTDYVIQYKASSSGTWLTFSDGTSTAKSATITGLTASTSYDVRVNAVTGAGNGDYSNVQTLSTSAASFSPTSITGLRLWIDGNDASTITSSGGLISQINDKSGQNNHIVQATGSRQPTYDGTAKSINFDGGDWLDRASFGMFNNGSVTCFAVTSDRVFVNADTLFAETGTSDFYTFQRLTGSGSTSSQIRVNAVTLLNDIPLNGTNLVPTAKHIQTYKDTGSLITYYENGVVGSSPQTYTRLISATMDRFALGGRIQNGADDRTINAKVYELLIYFGALSNSDINLIGNYLNTKWSVSWTNL